MNRDGLTPDDRILDFSAVLGAVATLGFAGLQLLHYRMPIGAALVVVAVMLAATRPVARLGVPRMTWISEVGP